MKLTSNKKTACEQYFKYCSRAIFLLVVVVDGIVANSAFQVLKALAS